MSLFLSALATALAIPVTILVIEVGAACIFGPRQNVERTVQRPRISILVPAHDESGGLLPTLEDLKAQLQCGDRLLVIADNCTDNTADIAKAAGADVLVRNNPTQVGKGYALDWGVQRLVGDPPAIVIVIDADCRVAPNAVDELAAACVATGRPVQALYLVTSPEQSPINYQLAEFAFLIKNKVRPLGLAALNLPCQLMGTGMAFPWEVIRSATLASGSIVEDLKLGLELAEAGCPPQFCPAAKVTSHFPWSLEGAHSQTKRWQSGQLSMIRMAAVRLLLSAILYGNMGLLTLTLDMLVPPLSLLVVFLVGMFCISLVALIFDATATALIISVGNILALALAVILSWIGFGRSVISAGAVLSIGRYIATKLALYGHLISRGSAMQWTRTDRKKNDESTQ